MNAGRQAAPVRRNRADALVSAAQKLAAAVGHLRFQSPVAFVYNPLDYAWPAHAAYLRKFGRTRKRVLFLGMNPGPFGMAQTGVPFGEISAVRDWLGIRASVGRPAREHPKRPVLGFDCPRAEVSGARLWGLFAGKFGSAEAFFTEHFVVNYCPLAFLAESGGNLTPDKLPARSQERLFAACDVHLRCVVAGMAHWRRRIRAAPRRDGVAGNATEHFPDPAPESGQSRRQSRLGRAGCAPA